MRLDMLDAQHPNRAFPPDDRHTGKAVKLVFTGFGLEREIGMRSRFVEVQNLDILGDRADQPLPHRHFGDVDRDLIEPLRGKQFKHAFAQQIDRADLAISGFPNDLDDAVQLGLCG